MGLVQPAPWVERVGAIFLTVVAVFAIKPLLHKSIETGMMGMMFYVYAIPPVLGPALVAWALATRRAVRWSRRATMAATILLACGVWTLFRTDGVMGGAAPELLAMTDRRGAGCSLRPMTTSGHFRTFPRL